VIDRRRDLLVRAGECYAADGAVDEAADCYAAAGDHVRAGELLRDVGRWETAGRHYQAAGQWRPAAECFHRAGLAEEAAACWAASGDRVRAAWELVLSEAPRRVRPEVLRRVRELAGTSPGHPGEALAHRIVRALATADPAESRRAAAELLAGLPDRWGGLSAGERADLGVWAVRTADLIGRPDLAAAVFASAYRTEGPAVLPPWREWCVAALGDATGVPEA